MNINEVMNRIHLSEEAVHVIQERQITEEEYLDQAELFHRDFKGFLEEWKKREDKEIWIMPFYMRMACDVYDRYMEEIPEDQTFVDQLFDESMYDFCLWIENYKRFHGTYGLKEAYWLGQTMRMKLFRLGRLQFEPIVIDRDLVGKSRTILKGTKMINVHIPEGEPLDYEACLNSFKRAEEFFGEGQEYTCTSWLLSPMLKTVLPEDSNIVRFQNLFEVVDILYFMPQAEQRIFGTIREDKENYPEESSLQKKTKTWFLEGKDPGIGVGFVDNVYDYISN